MSSLKRRLHFYMGRLLPWQFKMAAVVLTMGIVAVMSYLIQGRVTWDYLLTGFVTSLLVASMITDLIVGEYKQAGAALERYDFMVNAVGEMMSVIDRQHRYEAVNDRWCEVVGWTRESAVGTHLSEVWDSARYRTAIAPRIEQCFATGAPVSLQDTVDLPHGGKRECAITYYPYRAPSGKVAHVVVVTRDVTEQVQGERALQASETRLRTVLESMVDGVIVIDERGTIESFNPAAERMFGYRDEEVAGSNVKMLMPEPYRGAHDGYLQRYLATGEAHIIGTGREVTGLRKNGQTFPMELAVNSMTSDGRHRFVGVVRDISARKQTELELVQALEASQAAGRAKSEFLSSMSHELRTPMNAILGFAQLLDIDPALGAEQSDSVREILKAGQHLLELINEVLDLSRIEAGKLSLNMGPVALQKLLDQCVVMMEGEVQRQGLTLTRDYEVCAPYWVVADPLRLKQVLLNLLSNAIKYNLEGGEVRIECRTAAPGRIRLAVIDTGLGIPQEKQADLFGAFQRLGREHSGIEGTGIGLAISKRLVELMGGKIGMESLPGQGSTFWVELARGEAGNATA